LRNRPIVQGLGGWQAVKRLLQFLRGWTETQVMQKDNLQQLKY